MACGCLPSAGSPIGSRCGRSARPMPQRRQPRPEARPFRGRADQAQPGEAVAQQPCTAPGPAHAKRSAPDARPSAGHARPEAPIGRRQNGDAGGNCVGKAVGATSIQVIATPAGASTATRARPTCPRPRSRRAAGSRPPVPPSSPAAAAAPGPRPAPRAVEQALHRQRHRPPVDAPRHHRALGQGRRPIDLGQHPHRTAAALPKRRSQRHAVEPQRCARGKQRARPGHCLPFQRPAADGARRSLGPDEHRRPTSRGAEPSTLATTMRATRPPAATAARRAPRSNIAALPSDAISTRSAVAGASSAG